MGDAGQVHAPVIWRQLSDILGRAQRAAGGTAGARRIGAAEQDMPDTASNRRPARRLVQAVGGRAVGGGQPGGQAGTGGDAAGRASAAASTCRTSTCRTSWRGAAGAMARTGRAAERVGGAGPLAAAVAGQQAAGRGTGGVAPVADSGVSGGRGHQGAGVRRRGAAGAGGSQTVCGVDRQPSAVGRARPTADGGSRTLSLPTVVVNSWRAAVQGVVGRAASGGEQQ